jgi:hypothetical protein
MKICTPSIGDRLILTVPWTAEIKGTDLRNKSILECCYSNLKWWDAARSGIRIYVEFPIGTILTVDRIYIRKGASAFDSFTFRLNYDTNLKMVCDQREIPFAKGIRFFVSLTNACQIQFEFGASIN